MTPDDLEKLEKKATEGPWAVDPDDRPNMEWNNHIVQLNLGNTICFMAHDERDNTGQENAATLIATLRNLAPEIIELWRAAECFRNDRLSVEPIYSDLIHRSPADELRLRAEKTEERDKAIVRLRQALAKLREK